MRGGGRVVLCILGIVAVACSCEEAVNDHGIVLAVAIEVHGPDEFGAVVVAGDYLIVKVENEPYVGPGLCLVEEGLAHGAFGSVGCDGRDGVLGVVR